jgi:hypothetical protein
MASMLQSRTDRDHACRSWRGMLAHGNARWWIALLLLVVLGMAAAAPAIVDGGNGSAPESAPVATTGQDWIDPWSLTPDAAGRPDPPLTTDELARKLTELQSRLGAPEGVQLTDR